MLQLLLGMLIRRELNIHEFFRFPPSPGDSMMYQHSVGGVGGGCSPTNSTPPNLNTTCSPGTPPLTQPTSQQQQQQQHQQQQQQQQPGNNSSNNNNNTNPSQQNDNGGSEMVSEIKLWES